MALTEWRLQGIKRGLAALDQRLPMAPTMDGRLPLHQDCRELLAEVERLREEIAAFSAEVGTYYDAVSTGWVQDRLEALVGDADA